MSSDPQLASETAASVRVPEEPETASPVVSVVMPAYNVGDYITKAVQSILEQTLPNFEILIVDDCSSDHTARVMKQLAEEDSRVKPLFHDHNLGVSAARNTALENARGEWIAVVDPDDWIAPNRFERLIEIAEAYQADGVADNQFFVNARTEEHFGHLMVNGEAPISEMTSADFLNRDLPEVRGYGLLKLILRRSFVNMHKLRYRLEFPRGQDCVFYCDCLAKGARIMITNEPYYYYRIHREGSTTANTLGLPSILSIKEVQETIENIFDTDDPEVAEALARRKELIQECLHYRRVVDPLKDHQYGKALAELVGEPAYALKFAKRLSGAAWRRIARTNFPE